MGVMSSPRPIMVHGTVGGPGAFVGQEGAFAGAAAIALPGHPLGTGFASAPTAVGFVCEMARRVPQPRVLVGHELGAALALEACLADPGLAVGLVLVACGPGTPPTSGDDVDAVVAASVRDADGSAADLLRRELGATTAENRTRARMLAADLLSSSDLAAVDVPVLAVAGGDDPIVPPAQVEALATRLQSCRVAVVPGARHLVMADAAREFNLLLAAFLARVELDAVGT